MPHPNPMTAPEPVTPDKAGAYRYHLWRLAEAESVEPSHHAAPNPGPRLRDRATRSLALESQALGTATAHAITIGSTAIRERLRSLQAEYRSREAFRTALSQYRLDAETLRTGIRRELAFDALMRAVAADCPPVTEAAIRSFYATHPEAFQAPEARAVRHILITVNPDYPENTREAAEARIHHLAEAIAGDGDRFRAYARGHSECPSALEDGWLGVRPLKQLDAPLRAVLEPLPAGAMSPPVETTLGFHLLWCEAIRPARTVPLEQIRERIRTHLETESVRQAQKAWLAALQPTG